VRGKYEAKRAQVGDSADFRIGARAVGGRYMGSGSRAGETVHEIHTAAREGDLRRQEPPDGWGD
jgi:hypothetical protein